MGGIFSQFVRPFRYENTLPAPPQASHAQGELVHNNVAMNQGLSKNARKKLEREKKYQERKAKRKQAIKDLKVKKKLEKRAEREEKLKHLTESEREKFLNERRQVMKEGRDKVKEMRMQVRKTIEENWKYQICIDLGWNSHMYDNEKKSLCRQLAYSYNALRKRVEENMTPISISITGLDDVIKPIMSLTAAGWESWPLHTTEKHVDEVFPSSKLVYLTHDSDCVLDRLNPDDIYIIGGIVDRNRLKNATRDKAELLDIRTARFDLDSHISINHGTPVLTVNHCVEILLYVANGMSWKDAFLRVLPMRKGVASAPPTNNMHTLATPE